MSTPRETGHGSPDDLGGYDAGFGSPDDLGAPGTDTGFGEPSYLLALAGGLTVEDDGGDLVELAGDFSAWPGPYVVEVVDGDGNATTCYGVQPGRGYTCWPNAARNALPFATPPLPVGTYDLRVTGAEGVPTTVGAALTVVRRMWYSEVFAANRLWPVRPMPTGVFAVEAEPLLDEYGPDAGKVTIRAALAKAMGREATQFLGHRMTRLVQELGPADTTAHVESTFGMDDAGTVYVTGIGPIGYTSKTVTTLGGLTRSPYVLDVASPGSVVVDWSRTFTHYERARADLSLWLGSGDALDARAQELGVARGGPWMTDTAFREVALLVSQGEVAHWRALFNVLDAWTQQFRIAGSSVVSGAAVAKPPGETWGPSLIDRWIRITDTDGTQRLHRIRSASVLGLVLNATASVYCPGAAYATAALSWEILPFSLRPGQGVVRVRVALPMAYRTPPTYLQAHELPDYAAVTPPALTAPGVDLESVVGAAAGYYSGYVLDTDDPTADSAADIDPAVPLYVSGGGLEQLGALLTDLVALGIAIDLDTMPV